MKRSTCKVFIWIALIWLFICTLPSLYYVWVVDWLSGLIVLPIFILFLGIPSWILIIISIIKWNSEKEDERKEERKEEIHKAQLRALKTGKVNVEIKGKMKKLK